jgi:hypothetical protein
MIIHSIEILSSIIIIIIIIIIIQVNVGQTYVLDPKLFISNKSS